MNPSELSSLLGCLVPPRTSSPPAGAAPQAPSLGPGLKAAHPCSSKTEPRGLSLGWKTHCRDKPQAGLRCLGGERVERPLTEPNYFPSTLPVRTPAVQLQVTANARGHQRPIFRAAGPHGTGPGVAQGLRDARRAPAGTRSRPALGRQRQQLWW